MARTPSPAAGEGEAARVTLAAVAGAHGVQGEVRLKLLGEGIEALRAHDTFNDGALTLSKLRDDGKGGAIARFAEIADRGAAEALRGVTLQVPRADLPPLGDGEFYYADLIGLNVATDAGQEVGRVVAVENFGATDIVEIEWTDETIKPRRFMVPLTPAAVPAWDAHTLTISATYLP